MRAWVVALGAVGGLGFLASTAAAQEGDGAWVEAEPATETPAPAPAPAAAPAAPPVAAPPTPYYGTPPLVPHAPPPGYVPIVLRGKPAGVPLSLTLPRSTVPVLQCAGECLAYMPPQEYSLWAGATDTTLRGRRNVTIVSPTELTVTPRERSDRSAGLVMGISGIALVIVGSLVMAAGLVQKFPHDEEGSFEGRRGDDGDTLILMGVSGLVAGSILTPIGWVKFGRSAPSVSTRPL